MTSRNNLEKRLWEESPAGKIQLKAKKVYNRLHDKRVITEDDVRWLDIHRAKGMSKDTDLVARYTEKEKELKDTFKKEYDDMMIDLFQKELDYLISIEKRGQ